MRMPSILLLVALVLVTFLVLPQVLKHPCISREDFEKALKDKQGEDTVNALKDAKSEKSKFSNIIFMATCVQDS